jgi:hypothetical protein
MLRKSLSYRDKNVACGIETGRDRDTSRGIDMFAVLRRILNYHWTVTLLLMALFGLVLGIVTLDLFMLVQANFSLIAEHGVMALLDGGLLQLAELTVLGFVALVSYVLIRACEEVLVAQILR